MREDYIWASDAEDMTALYDYLNSDRDGTWDQDCSVYEEQDLS